jgi:hypothetical protein
MTVRCLEPRPQTRYTEGMRTLLCVLLVAGCGASHKPDPASGSGDGSGSGPPPVTAQTLLGFAASGWDATVARPKSRLFLEVTDHNGSTQSYPIGEVAAPCASAPGNGSDIVTTMRCDLAGTGAELRAVYRGSDVIVLRRNYAPGDDPADVEFAFQEVTRVQVPAGSKVKPAS